MFLPRTRTSNAQHPTQKVTYSHQADGQSGWSAPYSYSSQGYDGVSESISDAPHKGYRQAMNRGEIVMGDMVLSKYSRAHTDGDFTFGPWGNPTPGLGWGVRHVWGDFAQWVEGRIVNNSSITADLNQSKSIALTQAYARMNESTILSGEIANDIGRTLLMLRRPFKGSIKIFNRMLKYRKLRLGKTAASATKASAHAWLEYRMGLAPCISDIDSLLEDAAMIYVHGTERRRLVARASVPFERNLTQVQRLAGGLPQLDAVTVDCAFRNTGSASAGIIYEVKTRTTAEKLMQTMGLRLRDAPITLLEIIPYSFVADWFFNLGNWLQAKLPDPDINVLGSWVTTVDNAEMDLSIAGEVSLGPSGPYPKTTWSNLNCGSSAIKVSTVMREINPVVSSTPTAKATSLTWSQTADAASLVAMQGEIYALLAKLKH